MNTQVVSVASQSKRRRRVAANLARVRSAYQRNWTPRTYGIFPIAGRTSDPNMAPGRPWLVATVRMYVVLAVVAVVVMATATVGAVPTASAGEGVWEPWYAPFYTPPDPLPAGNPGDLIRSEPSRLVLEPSGQLGAYVATGTRIMYRSTDGRGNPVAVTGTYFEPDNPWPGSGPRPLIAFATGPYGLGDQCAPSRLFNQGIHFSQGFDLTFGYEETFIATMVARGFAVVVTDGVGLGTPGVPQFLNRLAAGQALLDAARAAMELPDTSLDPDGPVAFWGWSSGGQAAASAAELVPSYAPELKVVGTWAGAPSPISHLYCHSSTETCSSVLSAMSSTALSPHTRKPQNP